MGGRSKIRYTQDESGQWWYLPPGGSRKRIKSRQCPWCKKDYLSPDNRQYFCGHACAAASKHNGALKTTTPNVVRNDSLINSDNPRYTQDESGQWWYKPIGNKDHGRTRAFVKRCPECNVKFLTNVFHRRDHDCCSRSCGLKTFNKKNPGRHKGEAGPNWSGGRQVVRGYVWVWNPEAAERARPGTKKLYVLEHRLVMEKMLGRPLLPNENVHHKNGIRSDNSPENLELWVKCQPSGQRVQDLLKFARSILDTYESVESKLK